MPGAIIGNTEQPLRQSAADMRTDMADETPTEFEELASEKGLVGEFIEFLMENKKFWMVPILIVLLLLATLVVLGPSTAPFIYTLF
jgi:hypothetical protein